MHLPSFRRKPTVVKRKLRYPAPTPSVAVVKKVATKTAAVPLQKRKKKSDLTRQAPRKAIGGHGTFSMFASSHAPSRRIQVMKRAGQPNIDISNTSFQLAVNQGFQNASQIRYQGLQDLERIANRIGPHAAGVPPTNFVLESTVGEMFLTNSSLANLYVDIYDIVRKRDALQSDDTKSPVEAWHAGITDESGGAVTDGQMQVNSLPTDSKLFRDYFRVVKRTHISLAQGATHRHMTKLKANKLFDTSYLDRCDGDVAGTTVYTMIVAYGQPASITTESGAIVTTASGFIDVVQSVRLKYTFVSDYTNNWFLTDNLSTLAGEQVVSAGAGQIVPNARV